MLDFTELITHTLSWFLKFEIWLRIEKIIAVIMVYVPTFQVLMPQDWDPFQPHG